MPGSGDRSSSVSRSPKSLGAARSGFDQVAAVCIELVRRAFGGAVVCAVVGDGRAARFELGFEVVAAASTAGGEEERGNGEGEGDDEDEFLHVRAHLRKSISSQDLYLKNVFGVRSANVWCERGHAPSSCELSRNKCHRCRQGRQNHPKRLSQSRVARFGGWRITPRTCGIAASTRTGTIRGECGRVLEDIMKVRRPQIQTGNSSKSADTRDGCRVSIAKTKTESHDLRTRLDSRIELQCEARYCSDSQIDDDSVGTLNLLSAKITAPNNDILLSDRAHASDEVRERRDLETDDRGLRKSPRQSDRHRPPSAAELVESRVFRKPHRSQQRDHHRDLCGGRRYGGHAGLCLVDQERKHGTQD